ncbi:MAG: hypothetical protein GKR89_07515 [Candidatus Latescibacteria bacterium]|nr:hypothetical protein [Candidatus Latescibacterota bacterium]
MTDQDTNFANTMKPLGDWEWFWFEHPADGRRRRIKLIYPGGWQGPVIVQGDSTVVVRFDRRDVLEPGIDLEVEFILQRWRPALEACYTVVNGSTVTLQRPYVMVGFPGFGNHRRIGAVATARQRLLAPLADGNFRAQVQRLRLAELLLLRDDRPLPRSSPDTLSASVTIAEEREVVELRSLAVLDTSYTQAYSAHTIKPDYLSSHLYGYSRDMRPGQRRTLVVRHELVRRAGGL